MTQQSIVVATERSPWVAPCVETLPRLTELTLVTGGEGGSGGVITP